MGLFLVTPEKKNNNIYNCIFLFVNGYIHIYIKEISSNLKNSTGYELG